MSKSLRIAAPVPPPKLTRTELDELVRRRETLDEERKRLGREAAELTKQVGAIDKDLKAIVDAERKGPERTITLKNFVLSIVQVAKSVAWKSEFTKLAGDERVQELEAAAGTRDQFEIHWRAGPSSAPSASKAA